MLQQSTSARFGLPPAGTHSTGFVDSIKGLVIVAVVVLVVAWWFGYLPGGRPADKARLSLEKVDEKQRSIEETTASSVQRSQLKYAKVKQHQALLLAGDAVKALQDCAVEIDSWERFVQPLLESSDGRLIAGDDLLSRRFVSVFFEARLDLAEIERLAKTAFALHAERKEAFDSSTDASVPTDSLLSELRQLLDRASQARKDYRTGRLQVETILASARQSRQRGAKTLKQVLDAYEVEEAFARTARLETEVKKAKAEATITLAAEKMKLVNAENELALGKLRYEREAKRQGFVRTGSVWKGTLSQGGAVWSATFVISRREKDEIEGAVYWSEGQYKNGVGFPVGSVDGNFLRFKTPQRICGTPIVGFSYNLVLDPSTGTLIGTAVRQGYQPATLNLRWSEKE